MRISDWSSDVCSSDLPVPEVESDLLLGHGHGYDRVDCRAERKAHPVEAIIEARGIGHQLSTQFGPPLHLVQRFERRGDDRGRSEEHTSELQSLMRISYAVFCLKKKKTTQ